MKIYFPSSKVISCLFLGMTLIFSGVSGAETNLNKRLLADSVNGFSGVQGTDDWYYGYWNQSDDVDGSYDSKTDFIEFEQFGHDRVNGLSRHSEFETGPLWYLKDGEYYTSIWARGGHAHADLDLGVYARANHWVVRRWISSRSGVIEINGFFGKEMPWGSQWGGDVVYQVMVGGKKVWSQTSDLGEQAYSISVELKESTPVDFLIGPGSGIGVVDFTARIEQVSIEKMGQQ